MNVGLDQAGLWASLVLFVLCLICTGMGWNAYVARPGGDPAGNGMARGIHDLMRIALNVAAFLGAGCFALTRVFPTGALHLLVTVLGWILLPATLVLFVVLLRW